MWKVIKLVSFFSAHLSLRVAQFLPGKKKVVVMMRMENVDEFDVHENLETLKDVTGSFLTI